MATTINFLPILWVEITVESSFKTNLVAHFCHSGGDNSFPQNNTFFTGCVANPGHFGSSSVSDNSGALDDSRSFDASGGLNNSCGLNNPLGFNSPGFDLSGGLDNSSAPGFNNPDGFYTNAVNANVPLFGMGMNSSYNYNPNQQFSNPSYWGTTVPMAKDLSQILPLKVTFLPKATPLNIRRCLQITRAKAVPGHLLVLHLKEDHHYLLMLHPEEDSLLMVKTPKRLQGLFLEHQAQVSEIQETVKKDKVKKVTGPTHLSFYPKNVKEIIQRVQAYVQLHVSLHNPFLEERGDTEVFERSLQNAINKASNQDINVEEGFLDEHKGDIFKYLYSSQWLFRSSLKAAAQPLVDLHYKLPLPMSTHPTTGHNSQNNTDMVKNYVQELIGSGVYLQNGLGD
ncbi:hypothetical protein BT96DRAFT_948079 [Gymnopus androsaceus JB14]|uniref:DUF6532 domain-containing protein n=1 Tax=Gymnopus androsaceus JB14 TaxID=1447944 RepID=A0A6A4GQV3_9AGAR|nr:hypothetical protein BT96DRAFT_948079 [Gymnopus androsaceus JB14]